MRIRTEVHIDEFFLANIENDILNQTRIFFRFLQVYERISKVILDADDYRKSQF